MTSVLIVDDSPIDQRRAAKLLEVDPAMEISFAEDGEQALNQIRRQVPDLVVTDLQMPQVSGLELVQAMKESFPWVPVVLMTAKGSESIAAEALRKGAASYVPKTKMAQHLRETVDRILSASREDRMHSRLMHSLSQGDVTFVVQNDVQLLEHLASQLQQMLRCMPLGDEAERLRVGVALKHALLSAHYFGNLEMDAELEESDQELSALAEERSSREPYGSRAITVTANISPLEATFRVQHEGAPLNAKALLSWDAFHEGDSALARAFTLMQSIMDEVRADDSGRTIKLVKRSLQDASAEELAVEQAG